MRSEWTSLLSCCILLATGCGMRHVGDAGQDNAQGDTANTSPTDTQVGEGEGLSCLELYNAVSACYSIYYECAAPCQDQPCADLCTQDYQTCYDRELAQGSPEGQALFGELRRCEEENYQACYDEGLVLYNDCAQACTDDACAAACGEQASLALQDCLVLACSNEYGACDVPVRPPEVTPDNGDTGNSGGNGNGNGNSNSGNSLSCGELYNCEDACDGNRDCGQACYDRGSQTAQSQWTQLIECGQLMCDGMVSGAEQYRQCLQSMCTDLFNTCFADASSGGSGPTSYGDSSCYDGYTCVQGCYATATDEASFYGCVEGCYSTMDTEAHSLMDELVDCSQVECANVPGSIDNYYRCIEDFCPSEYEVCMDDVAGIPSDSGSSQPGAGSGGDTSQNATCLDIHESVLAICVPAFSNCSAACNNDACMQACNDDIVACIEEQKEPAPANEVANFDAVLSCRTNNYQTCYEQANQDFTECNGACSSGDSACQSACNEQADQTYESCFTVECASEYQACGIQ